ncbi:hotdog domain-containing protein [Sulfurimonas sp.]|jgi:acyl-CoA thioesterase|uniref:hotdog domain-containing protein n=1 Tax=Sulfurimonas sp. TaxID=2022749 RepID=UPI0025EBE3D4|nr:hotdog domain-containing protein [Sulfurimonas sp.]
MDEEALDPLQETEEENKMLFVKTHQRIDEELMGEITFHERGNVEVKLETTSAMVADDLGLVHGGFIFSAADYAAMVAVNEPNVVLIGSECQFLSPVKFHDEVVFKAKVRHKEGRKRNVHVNAYVYDVKVFSGEFKTVITEEHVLKLQLQKDGIKSKEIAEELPLSTE